MLNFFLKNYKNYIILPNHNQPLHDQNEEIM
ncbi:hypothetical protein KCQ_14985 [Pectobacterium atrosepticum ICMP 1526]|nr:hypothetical protein KCQ_14985 [Pectobacterium atrosepticum ICMP 1526]